MLVHSVRYARLTAGWKLGRKDEKNEVIGSDLLNAAGQMPTAGPVFITQTLLLLVANQTFVGCSSHHGQTLRTSCQSERFPCVLSISRKTDS